MNNRRKEEKNKKLLEQCVQLIFKTSINQERGRVKKIGREEKTANDSRKYAVMIKKKVSTNK